MRWFLRLFLRLLRRGALVAVFVVLLIASNLVLLTADAVYDATKRGLWALASVVTDVGQPRTHRANRETVDRLAGQIETSKADKRLLEDNLRRTRAELADLSVDNKALERKARQLALERDEIDEALKRTKRELSETVDGRIRSRVKDINEGLARRTSRMISTNMSAMAVESLPVLGAAAIVGVTYMEVRDACLTLADTREMSMLLSGEPEEVVPACGYSPEEFWQILRGGTDVHTCRDLNTEMPEQLRLDCVAVLRPGDGVPSPRSEEAPPDDLVRPGE